MTRLTLIQRCTAASRAAAARRSFSASAPEAGKHQNGLQLLHIGDGLTIVVSPALSISDWINSGISWFPLH